LWKCDKILEKTELEQWRCVPIKENVADESTRDNVPAKLSHWMNGPNFLTQPEWPQEKKGELKMKNEFVDVTQAAGEALESIGREFYPPGAETELWK